MKFQIEINFDKAQAEKSNGSEAARILRDLALQIDGCELGNGIGEGYGLVHCLRDFRGNICGKAKVKD